MGLLTGEALWTLAVAVVIFLLLVDLMPQAVQRWSARYPPGPVPLPGLGNLLQVDFQNMPCSINQVRKVGGGQQRPWGPHLAQTAGGEGSRRLDKSWAERSRPV